ncbi:MAG: twin-arginine translocase subunit TatC, partial [Nitrosopumilus sp.]
MSEELDGINQHLQELRKRIVRIVLVIGGISGFLLMFHAEPIQINQFTLYYPTLEPVNNM